MPIKRKALKELYEEFEDTKGVIRISKLKDRQYNGQKKKDKGQIMICKTHT
jgi:hypothetical protein